MKFSMSEAWSDATAMMSANREVLLIVAGIFFFLPGLLLAFGMADMQQMLMSADPSDPEQMQAMVMNFYGEVWWLALLSMLVQIVGYLSLLALLRDDARPTVAEALKAGLKGLLPAIGTYLLFTIGLVLVFWLVLFLAALAQSEAVLLVVGLLLFPAFVYLAVKVSLAGPVIAIDKVYNPFRVLVRSWRLTKGNSFRLFLFFLLIIIAYIVISMVLAVAVAALVLVIGTATGLLLSNILSGLASAILAVIFVAVLAAIHRQLAGPSTEAVSRTFE